MGCALEVKLEGRGVPFLAPFVALKGVQIGNVEPYKSGSLLMIESIAVKVDMKSLARSGVGLGLSSLSCFSNEVSSSW